MKIILFSLCLFSMGCCFSQNSALSITNLETHNQKLLRENIRIKITTFSGGKTVGKLKTIDEKWIL